MKKVLLVTLWDYRNFGNRLQAFALKHIIENLGYSVVCAVYDKETDITKIKKRIKEILGFIGVAKYRCAYLTFLRRCALRKSKRLYRPMTKTMRFFHTEGKVNPDHYITAVTGSDQVWHQWGRVNDLPYFYLSFMPKTKRIAYAASFGFEEFPKKDIEQHQIGLNGMRFISCREESGCRLVEQMIGKPGMLVVDPTLCADEAFWEKLEKKPRFASLKRPYILVLMLGKQDEYIQGIQAYANCNKLEIIDLCDLKRKDVWRTTIGGFLWLVRHADIICTDSFHCSVFAILYERPFQVFRRKQQGYENMYGRIETLLTLTGLEACRYDEETVRKVDLNYRDAKNRIEVEKEKSINWFKNALEELTKDQQD